MQIIKYYLLVLLTPLQRIMQLAGRAETLINKETVDYILSIVQPGDIVLSHERQRLTSIFIKGFWDHAAIVSNRDTVVEALGTGVQEVPVEEWLYKKDYVVIIRPLYIKKMVNFWAAVHSITFLGYKYNYSFSDLNLFRWTDIKRGVYCSQLVYLCYKTADTTFMLNRRSEILPIDFLNYPVVYNSKSSPIESKL